MSEAAVHTGGADPTAVIVVGAVAAVLFPTVAAVWRRLRNSAESSPPPGVPQESVRSIFDELEASRNSAATEALDDALVDLANELDPEVAQAKLDAAVKQWCIERAEGAGNPPSQAQMLKVLQALVQNVREASYRELIADHYRRLENSVDPSARPRVDEVYIRLRTEFREGAAVELDEPDDPSSDQPAEQILAHEYLDFRGKTPGDVEAALRQSGNLIILGDPGSGKSALLRYLAASCAESESADALLPVFLPLRDYAGGQDVLIAESAVTFAEGELQLKMSEGFFDEALSHGRCVVFLDALDEVPTEQRRGIVNRVEQLTRRYPRSRFVVTSRIAGYYDEAPLDGQIFMRCVAEPMDDEGIKSFIGRLYGEDKKRAQNLHDVLDANPSIKSLVSNPLLMAILNMVYRDDNQEGLPLNRAKFYEQAVELMVADDDERLLTATALFLHKENRETIASDELEDLVEDFLLKDRGKSDNPIPPDEDQAYKEAETFIERVERRSGLLVEQDSGSGVFRFVHATFREYLTAKDIHNRNRNYRRHREACWEELKDHLTDPRWREVILLLLGILGERYCTYLTEKILAAGDETVHQSDIWRRPTHLQLAAEALTNQAPMSSQLQQEIVGRLEVIGKGNGYGSRAYVQDQAARALGAIRHLPEIVTAALTAIATMAADGHVRVSAARELGLLGERARAIAELTAIANDTAVVDRVRARAGRVLVELGEEGIAALTAIAKNPETAEDDRRRAIDALAGVPGRRGQRDNGVAAKAALVQLAQDKAVDAVVRGRAGWLLGRLGETETAIATLTDVVTDTAAPPIVKIRAAGAIQEFGGSTEVPIAAMRAGIADLEIGIGNRISMAWRLGDLGEEEEGIETLAAIANDKTVDDINLVRAAWFLGELDASELARPALSVLTAVAEDETAEPDLRFDAGKVLANLSVKETAIIALTAVANNTEAHAADRIEAAKILVNLGETATAETVLQAIVNSRPLSRTNRQDAREALRALRGERSDDERNRRLKALLERHRAERGR